MKKSLFFTFSVLVFAYLTQEACSTTPREGGDDLTPNQAGALYRHSGSFANPQHFLATQQALLAQQQRHQPQTSFPFQFQRAPLQTSPAQIPLTAQQRLLLQLQQQQQQTSPAQPPLIAHQRLYPFQQQAASTQRPLTAHQRLPLQQQQTASTQRPLAAHQRLLLQQQQASHPSQSAYPQQYTLLQYINLWDSLLKMQCLLGVEQSLKCRTSSSPQIDAYIYPLQRKEIIVICELALLRPYLVKALREESLPANQHTIQQINKILRSQLPPLNKRLLYLLLVTPTEHLDANSLPPAIQQVLQNSFERLHQTQQRHEQTPRQQALTAKAAHQRFLRNHQPQVAAAEALKQKLRRQQQRLAQQGRNPQMSSSTLPQVTSTKPQKVPPPLEEASDQGDGEEDPQATTTSSSPKKSSLVDRNGCLPQQGQRAKKRSRDENARNQRDGKAEKKKKKRKKRSTQKTGDQTFQVSLKLLGNLPCRERSMRKKQPPKRFGFSPFPTGTTSTSPFSKSKSEQGPFRPSLQDGSSPFTSSSSSSLQKDIPPLEGPFRPSLQDGSSPFTSSSSSSLQKDIPPLEGPFRPPLQDNSSPFTSSSSSSLQKDIPPLEGFLPEYDLDDTIASLQSRSDFRLLDFGDTRPSQVKSSSTHSRQKQNEWEKFLGIPVTPDHVDPSSFDESLNFIEPPTQESSTFLTTLQQVSTLLPWQPKADDDLD